MTDIEQRLLDKAASFDALAATDPALHFPETAALLREAAKAIGAGHSALQVPSVWSAEEQAELAMTFAKAERKHGYYETLFAVAATSLRLAQKRMSNVLQKAQSNER